MQPNGDGARATSWKACFQTPKSGMKRSKTLYKRRSRVIKPFLDWTWAKASYRSLMGPPSSSSLDRAAQPWHINFSICIGRSRFKCNHSRNSSSRPQARYLSTQARATFRLCFLVSLWRRMGLNATSYYSEKVTMLH